MPLQKMSEVAAHNKQTWKARNYRIGLKPPDGFTVSDYVPVVVYNAFVGSNGKGMRSLAQKTNARLFSDHAILDEFDPAVDWSLTPDGYPLFELVAYLIDSDDRERLFFTIKHQKHENQRAQFPSAEFPIGSHPTVRIYTGRTRDNPGRKVAEVKASISETGLKMPEHKIDLGVSLATGQSLPLKDLSYWLVAPNGEERYAFSGAMTLNEPPRLSSLLREPESIH